METRVIFKNGMYWNRVICDYDEYWEKHFIIIGINIEKTVNYFRVFNGSNLNQELSTCF